MSTLAMDVMPAKRPWRHFVALVMVLLAILLAFTAAEWDFEALTDPDRRAAALRRMGEWFVAFGSPDLSGEFLARAWDLTLQTLSAAVLGVGLALVIAWPLAMGASRAVCVGEEKGVRGFWAHFPLRSPAALLCSLCRLIQDVLRSVPDFVWAIILVAMIGLGPLTGALAIALNVAGILAKVYSELWDSVDESRYAQVRTLGAGRVATFLYGIRPLASRNVLSFTLMRAECAIRNAAVIGAVGGGGLGSEIWYQIRFGAWDKVSTLIVCTLLLTLTADLVSNYIRAQLRSDPNAPPRSPRAQAASAGPPVRPWLAVGVATVIVAWSVWFMGWGNSAGDGGQTRNHLTPAVELFTGQAWDNLSFFEGLAQPELDLAAVGIGEREAVEALREQDGVVELFSEYPPWQFWQPAAWAAWQEQLQKWFVWRVVESATIPLAIAVVGTVLGVAGAVLLAYPHSAIFQFHAPRFSGETPSWPARSLRGMQLVVARLTGLVSRGVPEIMWAFLFIAFFGPGLVAGTLAIAIHTLGVLVRVFGEAVDNLPYRRFEAAGSASRMTCFGMVAAPLCWRDWMTYSFFQFESNVRSAVVLGLIGVGGLGFQFSFNFEWFRFERAGTYLIMIVLLTVIIDRTSRLLKLSRVGR